MKFDEQRPQPRLGVDPVIHTDNAKRSAIGKRPETGTGDGHSKRARIGDAQLRAFVVLADSERQAAGFCLLTVNQRRAP